MCSASDWDSRFTVKPLRPAGQHQGRDRTVGLPERRRRSQQVRWAMPDQAASRRATQSLTPSCKHILPYGFCRMNNIWYLQQLRVTCPTSLPTRWQLGAATDTQPPRQVRALLLQTRVRRRTAAIRVSAGASGQNVCAFRLGKGRQKVATFWHLATFSFKQPSGRREWVADSVTG